MDKAAIQQFSDTLREKLLLETQKRAAVYGIHPGIIREIDQEFEDSIVIDGKVFNKKIKKPREQFVQEIREKGYDQVIDEVTYTWFNRFVALKFMEVNGYLPVKVFSSSTPGKVEPDILTNVLSLDFLTLDREIVLELKSKGKDEELYKYLVLHLCNYLHEKMPFLFEVLEDYSELLFPERLLHTDSILGDLNTIIAEEDWKEVEIIGWIYQDYVTPRKNKIFADLKKNIKINKENIPAATQQFTPKWIVKYMVENSVGRTWLESNPNLELQAKFKYFVKQDVRILDKKNRNLEELTILDPAMGSGHILVYAFEVLYEIYKSQGYLEKEISTIILNKNLFGLEIDDRAGQLAGFAVIMQARKFDRDLFTKKIHLNLCSIQETKDKCILSTDKYPNLSILWDFFIDAKEFGSLLNVDELDLECITSELNAFKREGSLDSFLIISKLEDLVKQTNILSLKYDCVITNPPYMGSKGMNSNLRKFVWNAFPDAKSDLMTCFMEKGLEFLKSNGFLSMINIHTWMFISTYQNLRMKIINNNTIYSLIHNGRGIFGPDYGTVAFVINKNKNPNFIGVYRRLFLKQGNVDTPQQKEEWFLNSNFGFFLENQDNFIKIPGSPIAYWINNSIRNTFKNDAFFDYTISDGQNKTGDNDKYLRNLWEVSYNRIISTKNKNYRWIFYAKGGEFRKWYGNIDYVIDWSDSARKHYRKDKIARLIPEYLWFKKGISWNLVSSSKNAFRILEEDSTFDVTGSSVFIKDEMLEDYDYFLGFLNTKIVIQLLNVLNPTISCQVKDIRNLPIIFTNSEQTKIQINKLTQECIDIAREEWDSRETSLNFKTNELLRHKTSNKIIDTYGLYCIYWREDFFKVHANEEELNRKFIEIYNLTEVLTPEIALEDITLLKDESRIIDNNIVFDKEAIIKQFISYAVGCMFGRYSPHKDGMILANKGESLEEFGKLVPNASFIPDDDNIIPILDDEYFTDDIVTRFKEFLKVTFGEDSLAKNLEFIGGALSPNGSNSPEKTIRNYFLKSFYKDHLQMYNKRPIYWLFTSGENQAFNALIYMHRYEKSTLSKMRTDYLLELESKLDASLNMLSSDPVKNKTKITNLRKQIDELKEYDALLNNKALALIDFDLDDGVVVNYKKFDGLVKPI